MTIGDPKDLGQFRTTRWSVVVRAGDGTDGADQRAALDHLCRVYWYPLYALARRRGLEVAGAEDAVQSFFADLLSRGDVGRADPERGRFRAFLGTAFRNFLANAKAHERALKRGGGATPLQLEDAESRYAAASGRGLEPDALFDRAWALAMLEVALARLRASYAARAQESRFTSLKGFLTGAPPAGSRAEIAAELGLTEGALGVAVHRLRERYRAALLGAVRDTVDSDEAVAAELEALFAALGG